MQRKNQQPLYQKTEKKNSEKLLQHYLTCNHGNNLKLLDENLTLEESEHIFKGGRIDILAHTPQRIVAVELKAANYSTTNVCAQLMNYINYISPKNGIVYFVAPKIKYGIYTTLKNYYDEEKIKLFEYSSKNNKYTFREISITDLNDKRKISYSKQTDTIFSYDNKLKKGLEILIKDKSKCNLAKSIINSNMSEYKHLEEIADAAISTFFGKKHTHLRTIYELFKLL